MKLAKNTRWIWFHGKYLTVEAAQKINDYIDHALVRLILGDD